MLLNELNTKELSINLGESLNYNYIRQASVGLGVRVNLSPKGILEVSSNPEKALNPNPDSNGGDKRAGTFIFKAVCRGNVNLSIQKTFREKLIVQDTYTIKVC